MTFRKSAPAALIAAVVIVVFGLTALSYRLFSGLTTSVEDGQFQLMQSITTTALSDAAESALARADLLAALPTTKQAVAAKERDRLIAEYGEMFTTEKDRHSVDQVQFHVPPAVSLLRLHNLSAFGDDLTPFRPTVVAVNREHAARSGLAVAFQGPAIFGVAPIKDEKGSHIGSVEFGLDFGGLLNGLKAAYGLDFALYVEEGPLRQFARGLDPAVMSEQNRVGRFIRYHTTNGALMRDLVSDGDISDVTEAKHFAREAQGLAYGVVLMPLSDTGGNPLGVIAVARDFSPSRAAAGRSLVWQICLAIFAVILLAVTILVVIRGFLLRPIEVLNGRFAALAAGEPALPLEGSDRFCAEMRELAGSYEELRSSKSARERKK
jgi:methyl-accepting chemotaxis protein